MKKILLLICLVTLFLIPAKSQPQTVGLFVNDTGSFNGYTLFSPSATKTAYLIDNCGFEINSWNSAYFPGIASYFLENGNMIRAGRISSGTFSGGGSGGILEEFDWNGNVVWSYIYSNNAHHQHHDFEVLPNGNILILAWQYKSSTEAIAEGVNPATIGAQIWPEEIIEIDPIGTDSANIVWQWNAWDHLIQDFDSTKNNFGVVADHPELINLNYHGISLLTTGDWIHANSIDYNPDLDQIIISAHNFDEFWVIDHSTTTAEAASHTGGNYNKGGDLLYRWGNPITYNRGAVGDQKLFGQHDAHWIPNGLLDGGKIMVFNNGLGRPSGSYSTIEVIDPDIDSFGNYIDPGVTAFGPSNSHWTYTAPTPTDFFSVRVSGVQRLPNGNTIICEGRAGNIFEIDTAETILWNYKSPVGNGGPVSQGSVPISKDIFRAYKYAPTYPGFDGLTLTPGNPVELNPTPSTCVIDTTQLSAQAFVQNHVSCFGLSDGSASISAIGGISPFTYTWSNGSSSSTVLNVAAGTYTATVSDNNGSSATATIVIYQTEEIDATITTNDPLIFCRNPGSGTLLESVINPNYSKQWLKAGNPIAGATGDTFFAQDKAGFKVFITDHHGCAKSGNKITLDKFPLPPATLTVNGLPKFCGGDSLLLEANLGLFTYQWLRYGNALPFETNNTFYATKGGKYKVLVTDTNNCFNASPKITVTKNVIPKAVVSPTTAQLPSPICDGDSILLTASSTRGLAPFSYQWFRYNTLLSGQTNSNYVSTNFGGYSVKMTDANGCSDKSARTVINESCRVQDPNFTFNVYPNPFSSEFKVEINNLYEVPLTYSVYNSIGNLVFFKYSNKNLNEINLSEQKAGIYLLKITGTDIFYKKSLLKVY